MSDEPNYSQQRILGRVKWFDTKKGYGFIIPLDKLHETVFAYHDSIKVKNEQYRYLVEGEYVEFEYSRISRNDVEKLYATNITGVKSGLLMCETRKITENNRPSRNAE